MNNSQDRMPYLAHNLRTVRRILGISQCEMAEKLDYLTVKRDLLG